MTDPHLVSSSGEIITPITYLPTILLVDDTLTNLKLLEDIFENLYNIPTAQNGEDAWALLVSQPRLFSVILLDRMMPDIQGDEVLRRMQRHDILKHTPVIFQTAKITEKDTHEGLALGADYYINKPYNEEQLLIVVKAAVHKHAKRNMMYEEVQKMKNSLAVFSLAHSGSLEFRFNTLRHAEKLAIFLSHACPSPNNVFTGLFELMCNAVEHGIANITYDEKTDLLNHDNWREELEKRLQSPENRNRYATVRIDFVLGEIGDREIQFIIKDPGEGFDHQKYLLMDESRILDNHGRGIAMGAKLTFYELRYNEKGNEVAAILRLGHSK